MSMASQIQTNDRPKIATKSSSTGLDTSLMSRSPAIQYYAGKVQTDGTLRIKNAVNELIELRNDGEINDENFANLMTIFITRYVESEVNDKVNRLMNDKLSSLMAGLLTR